MRLLNVFHLYRARARARAGQEAFAILGIAVGVALLFASQVANTSLTGSVAQLSSAIVGRAQLQLTARSQGGFSERLLDRARHLPGVAAAAPLLEHDARVAGPSGGELVTLIGIDPRFVHIGGQFLRSVHAQALAAQQGLALPEPISSKVGAGNLQPVALQIGASSTQALVLYTLGQGEIGPLVHSPVVVAPLAYAQRLTGMEGRITRALVQALPGREGEVRAGLEWLVGGGGEWSVGRGAGLAGSGGQSAAGRGSGQAANGAQLSVVRGAGQVGSGARPSVGGGVGRLAGSAVAVDVRPAGFEATLFAQAAGPTSYATAMFSAVSALVGFLFAFNAMLLTAPGRRGLLAELRLDGYSPAQIARVLVFDALMIALAGVILGLAAGDILSREFLNESPGYLALAFPVGSQRIVTWQCVAIAAGGGLVAAVVGVIAPLRGELFARPVHTPPAPARLPAPAGSRPSSGSPAPGGLSTPVSSSIPAPSGGPLGCSSAPSRSPAPSRSRPPGQSSARAHCRALLLPTAGVVCLAVPGLLVLTGIGSLGVALIAMGCLVLALLLLLPQLFDLSLALFDRMQRPLRAGSAQIALLELRSPSTRMRSLAVVATGAIAVLGSVAIQGAHGELQHGIDRAGGGLSRNADVWVTPYGPANLFATSPFADTVSSRIGRIPGVRSVGVYHASLLNWNERRIWVFAPPNSDRYVLPPGEITSGSLAPASARVRRGGWAVVSAAVAAEHGLGVGSRFVLPAPRPLVLRVAALTTNDGWAPGAITMNASDYARAWGSSDPSALNVMLAPSVSPDRARVGIQRVLGVGSPLRAETAAERESAIDVASRQGLSRLTQIARIVLVGAALAMATAMGAMIWQRRKRLAALKIDGLGQGELWRALVYESFFLLSTGCVVGAIFGLYGQLILTQALTAVTGFPVIGTLALGTAAAILAVLSIAATLVIALPGWLAARVAPAAALGE